ncbi:MAG: metallophosphoesterase [Pseudomonadota bacterium]|nr:metallophosphoesterase [Pseudomonadota bacterium]
MFTVIQISDTHLSPDRSQFVPNWRAVGDWVRTQRPALVINTGDVSLDGADNVGELRFCNEEFAALGTPVLCVPGNHDVGDAPHITPGQPVNDERQARWRGVFGHDWWFRDIENWRLVGINNMLFGTGYPDEAIQLAWLERLLQDASDRRLALFMHRPAFVCQPDEPEDRKWSLHPEPRAHFLKLVSRHRMSLVAAGHLHRARLFHHAGTQYVWCPSAAFVCGPLIQRDLPGEQIIGAVIHTFGGESVRSEFVQPPGTTRLVIDDFVDDVYPGTLARLALRRARGQHQ